MLAFTKHAVYLDLYTCMNEFVGIGGYQSMCGRSLFCIHVNGGCEFDVYVGMMWVYLM